MSIESAVSKYLEECNCGHARGSHYFEPDEDSIICEECSCAGFDTEPPEPYVPDHMGDDV